MKNSEIPCDTKKAYLRHKTHGILLLGFLTSLVLSVACATTQELAPTFIPPSSTPLPSETPLPSPTSTPIPDPTELTSIMAPPTPTSVPGGVAAEGASCIPNNEKKTMMVTGILSGDTILVEVEKRNVELLLIGLSAPIPDTEEGKDATIRLAAWADGKTVTIIHDQDPRNRYGQLEAFIMIDDLLINYEMVRRGYVRSVTSKTNPTCNEVLQLAEESAQHDEVGIWADSTTAP